MEGLWNEPLGLMFKNTLYHEVSYSVMNPLASYIHYKQLKE